MPGGRNDPIELSSDSENGDAEAELRRARAEIGRLIRIIEALSNAEDQANERADEANARLVDTSAILDRIRDRLECSVCYRTMRTSVTIHECNHSFGFRCLRLWFFQRLTEGIPPDCPTCRVRVRLQPSRVYALGEVLQDARGDNVGAQALGDDAWVGLPLNPIIP